MSLTADITHILRLLESDAGGGAARTTVYRIETQTITGATRHDSKAWTVSAGLSPQAVDVTPVTASQPGSFLWLAADQPVDLRLNDVSATILSGVYQLMLAMSAISSLFLTPPVSADATVRLELLGGGSLQFSQPLP